MDLKTLCKSLQYYPLLHCLKLKKLTQFLRYSNFAWGLIKAKTVNICQLPDTILLPIQTILAACIHEDPCVISQIWSAFKGKVWQAWGIAATEDKIQAYNKHALPLKSCEFWVSHCSLFKFLIFQQPTDIYSHLLVSVSLPIARITETQAMFPHLLRQKLRCLLKEVFSVKSTANKSLGV